MNRHLFENNRRLVSVVGTLQVFLTMLCVFFVSFAVLAQQPQPESWAQLGEGDYLSARNSPELATITERGYTLEGWFYIESEPPLGEYELILASPGAFAFAVINAGGGRYIMWNTRSLVDLTSGSSNRAGGAGSIDPGEWHHFFLQYLPDGANDAFMVRSATGSFGLLPAPIGTKKQFADRSSDLYVGGVAPDAMTDLETMIRESRSIPAHPLNLKSAANIRIGPIRISSAVQYPSAWGDRAFPPRPFDPEPELASDADTVALWRFAEGPNAASYADEPGRSRLLVRNGDVATAVSPVGRLAATWANLKGGTR